MLLLQYVQDMMSDDQQYGNCILCIETPRTLVLHTYE